ncbi:MAG TPA: hypothetical protein VGS12_06175 [Caulobacteraceae bacterium]|nr:hypothetical protein [Caulobacteraceae bacterium]
MARKSDATRLPATAARQGRSGVPVLVVLLASTALAVIVVLIVWLFRTGEFTQATHRMSPSPAQAAAQHAPPPNSVIRQVGAPVSGGR